MSLPRRSHELGRASGTFAVSAARPLRARVARAALVQLCLLGVASIVAACSSSYDVPLPPAQACDPNKKWSEQGCPPAWLCDPATSLCAPKGDVDCRLNAEPSQGDTCTVDCLDATCASERGRRVCTCEGGVFVQCACLPPDNWPYDEVPATPYCDRLTGQPIYLTGDRCTLGQQCLSSTAPGQSCICATTATSTVPMWQCGLAANQGVAPGAPECESLGTGMQAVLKNKPCFKEWELCIARDYNPDGTSPRGCGCFEKDGSLEWYCGSTNRWWRAE